MLDAFTVAADGTPDGELFVYITDTIAVRQTPLVSVALPALRSPQFNPPGTFAVYADRYDATVKDYTRWLVSQGGCLTVNRIDTGSVARAVGSLTLTGAWQSRDGTSLGSAAATANFNLPVLRLPFSSGSVRDTFAVTTAGARSDTMRVPAAGTGAVNSYQELIAGAPRLVVSATSPKADSTRELLLSIAGAPLDPDSIPLARPTIDEARAARAGAKSFGMFQVNTASATNPQARVIRQLWRSSGGPGDYVRLTNIVQTGPLTFCGYATGRFRFDAIGDDPQTVPPTPLAGSLTVAGSFATVVTVLKPSNTITATSADMVLSRLMSRSIAVSPSPLMCAH
ncbi:MAG: hypothetical protein NVS1B4_21240 [Gemmatimonadaceae bacterium]